MISTLRKLRKIGSGGFGEVWLAEREHDKRQFAMKFLMDSRPESIARFQREVRCLSQLDHPNIVRVNSKSLAKAPFWYAMQPYSHSLYRELRTIKGQNERIYPIFRAILDGVRYAHAEGVIHRDLKPENVLMNADTDLVVSDFGLGRILDSKSTRLTVTGARIGTVLYCAPEQMLDFKEADRRSDVFSLGRMLYELYSGELTTAIQDLSLVPAPIAAIVERATATKPDSRYQTVDSMFEDFEQTMEIMLGIVEAGSLDDLIEKLRIASAWTDEDITKLSAGLEGLDDEEDTIHSALMKIPPNLFARIAIRSRVFAKTLVKVFSRHSRSQGWPFSYTDLIGDVAKGLFDALNDPEMRAELFAAALVVGSNHNRWYVMSIAADLLQSTKETAEIAAVAKVLKDNPAEAGYLQGYVTRSKLAIQLRQFFPKPESEQA